MGHKVKFDGHDNEWQWGTGRVGVIVAMRKDQEFYLVRDEKGVTFEVSFNNLEFIP